MRLIPAQTPPPLHMPPTLHFPSPPQPLPSYFLAQESFDTLPHSGDIVGAALHLLIEGSPVQLDKYNGNPIALQLPMQVELEGTYTEPGVRGDTAGGNVSKPAKLETGIEVR